MEIILVIILLMIFSYIIQRIIEKIDAKKYIEQQRQRLLGKKLNTRLEILDKMENILLAIQERLNREIMVVLYLSSNNIVQDAEYRLGDKSSVTFPQEEIIDKATTQGAKKLLIGHNHPTNNPTPSDADVRYGAHLYLLCQQREIELVDDFVLCRDELKSVKNALRFKQLVKTI